MLNSRDERSECPDGVQNLGFRVSREYGNILLGFIGV